MSSLTSCLYPFAPPSRLLIADSLLHSPFSKKKDSSKPAHSHDVILQKSAHIHHCICHAWATPNCSTALLNTISCPCTCASAIASVWTALSPSQPMEYLLSFETQAKNHHCKTIPTSLIISFPPNFAVALTAVLNEFCCFYVYPMLSKTKCFWKQRMFCSSLVCLIPL